MSSATAPVSEAVRRPVTAAVLLLLVYVLLGLAVNPDGHLGTDTGAKVYTLETMDRDGSADPDIGYWAADLDPDGSAHPIFQTRPRADGGWVAITTLPVLELARPLYAVGGYRATLLLPMLGSIGVAFAARSLATRLGADRDRAWLVYWVVGLGSPAFVYALDFWEHSIGLACMVGAVAATVGFVSTRRWTLAAAAGGLLGVGATLRNETIIYALVTIGLAGLWLLGRERSIRPAAVLGTASVAAFAVPWTANAILESVVDGPSRASRATGTASRVGERFEDRVEDGVQTLAGLNSGDAWASALLGGVIILVVLAAMRSERRGDRRFAAVALGAVGLAYAADAVGGLGFVPGVLIAFPVAILGLATGWRDRGAPAYAWLVAVLALPFVYAFQYLGGAAAQWGARYSLTTGIVLGVVALTVAVGRYPTVSAGLVVLSLGVTWLGVGWVVERSHDVDSFFDEMIAEAEPVVIARQAFLLREAGASAVGRRWLSASDEATFTEAVGVAREVGESRFSVLEWRGEAPPEAALPDDVREVERAPLSFAGTPVGLVTYEFTG